MQGGWTGGLEAIVVVNGSADRTVDVACSFERRDPRVRVEQREVAGVSAARNAGIAVAHGEWLPFHDADDTLEPQALELLLREARREPRPDAAVCGWLRVAPDGTRFDEFSWDEADDAFDSLAITCGFAIHCHLRRGPARRGTIAQGLGGDLGAARARARPLPRRARGARGARPRTARTA